MAEALGIAAAVVQLIDLGGRLLIASSRLCSDLKNVPRNITTMRNHIEQFIDLLRVLDIDFITASNLPSGLVTVSPQDLHILSGLLKEATKQAAELAALLERLSTIQGNSLQRAWSVVVSVKKQEEIITRSQRLESLKSTLQLLYNRQSTKLAHEQILRARNSDLAIQSAMDLIRDQYSNILLSNEGVLSQIKSLNQHISPMQHTKAQPKDWISLPQSISQQCVKSCSCSNTRQSAHLSLYAFQVFIEKQTKRGNEPYCIHSAVSWAVGVRTFRPILELVVKLHLGKNSASISTSLFPHNIVDRTKSPAFAAIEKARQNIVFLLRIDQKGRLPAGSYFDNELVGSYEPEIGTPQRRKYGELNYSGGAGCYKSVYVEQWVCLRADQRFNLDVRAITELLCERLRQAFVARKASPRDQDVNGDTLLHEFVCFAMCALCLQEDVSSHLTEIIRLLANGGADLNAIAKRKNLDCLRINNSPLTWTVSPLSVLINYLRSGGFSPRHVEELRLDRILVESGCTMSEPIHELEKYPGAVRLFVRNPTLASDLDYPALYMAVINRSEHDLRQIIRLRRVNVHQTYNGIAPLSFAVGWNVGMKILLDAGADPATAIHVAIHQEDLQGIELLLDNGCPIFTPQSMTSQFSTRKNKDNLMAFALDKRSSTPVISLLIDKIAERRYQLQVLALHHLSLSTLQTLEIDQDGGSSLLPDKNSYQTFTSLQEEGIRVPTHLWPGTRPSLYHYENMRYPVARKLYNAGFQDLDVQDRNGITPLIETMSPLFDEGQYRLIKWYLKKGADPALHQIGLKNCLHVFSHSNAFKLAAQVWNTTPWSQFSTLGIFQCLSEVCGAEIPDQCSCWCSSFGCLPAGIVLRHTCGIEDMQRRRRWLLYLPHYSLSGLCLSASYFSDICRLEIFDRLGMAHTCCQMSTCSNEYEYVKLHYTSRSIEERHEIQNEDSEFKLILDAYVELYQRLLQTYATHFKPFWIAWWITLDKFLLHDSPQNLYESFYNTLDDAQRSQSQNDLENLKLMTDGYGPDCVGIEATLAAICEALKRDEFKILDHLNPSAHENLCIEMLTHSEEATLSFSSNSSDFSDEE